MGITKRSDRLAFCAVAGADTTTYKRMTNFTEMSISKNPKEYTRQYVDEAFERSDVVGYAPSISYSFDHDAENEVHGIFTDISDNERVGDAAKVSIIIVELDKEKSPGEASFVAIKRDFSVIPDSEGGETDAYTYGGTLKANGDITFGSAVSTDGWQTITFTADED